MRGARWARRRRPSERARAEEPYKKDLVLVLGGVPWFEPAIATINRMYARLAENLRNAPGTTDVNIRIPYNRVCPLEMLSSYQGRLGPGDLIWNFQYPPGFTKARAAANNATLGVNTLSRVVELARPPTTLLGGL